MSRFRELEPMELWSANIYSHLDRALFEAVLEQIAQESAFTFFGFFVVNGIISAPVEYHFTRYPRRKNGILPLTKYSKMFDILSRRLQQLDSLSETSIEHSFYPKPLRTLLGLREGYESANFTHSLTEVRQALGSNTIVRPGEVYTVGPTRKYQEPVAVIFAEESSKRSICELAENFKQERLTMENFENRQAYVVETLHAKFPDTE